MDYAENGTGIRSRPTYVATDQDGDDIEWSIRRHRTWTDFDMDGGDPHLSRKSPNFEVPQGGSNGGLQHLTKVTIDGVRR